MRESFAKSWKEIAIGFLKVGGVRAVLCAGVWGR
jgi:hypothetical protein